ncbi:hypothetical protein KSD_61740 [Ktedonobacter sp. SOSP1-85]|nr:hypothetical protein KSD_61740 [Ktedonobacter sp. SOSP1-85]
MLLGIVIALLGVGLAQPANNELAVQTFGTPSQAVIFYYPLFSLLLIFLGTVVGIIGYFQKN